MGTETKPLENIGENGVDFPLEEYDVGFNSAGPSYAELLQIFASELNADIPTIGATVGGEKVQTALDGFVGVAAPGLGVGDAIDPATTNTPVGDAVALVEAAGGGAVLLPPERVEESAHVAIDAGISTNILGTSWRQTEVAFTDTTDSGFVVNSPSSPPATGSYWHNFTIHGGDASQRVQDATSALYFNHGPKDFNLGAIAFKEWNGSVISGDAGQMAYGATWEHLAFGYGESNNKGSLINLRGQGAPLRIGTFHAATSTTDPLITTDQARHVYLDIGTMNIGGEHGPIIDINGGSYSIVNIGETNFEPVGSGTAAHAIRFRGKVKGRVGPFLSKTGTVDDVFVLNDDHESAIGPVAVGPAQTLNNAVVRLAGPADGDSASWYYGSASDIDYGGQSRADIIPLADPAAVPTPTTRTSSNYAADYGEIVLCDTSAGSVTVTLPAPAQGVRVIAENILSASGNNMEIVTPGSATIDDEASIVRGTQDTGNELVCDGTDWWSI